MALHQVPIGGHTDALEVSWFNSQAQIYVTNPQEGDTGIFVDDSSSSVMPEGRYYKYNNKLWFLNILPSEFDDLHVGVALDFRETLNDNFSQISDQADTVDKNLELLKTKLKPIATTAAASDLTTDSAHQTVSSAEKTYWNTRSVYVAPESETGQHKIYYDNGSGTAAQDITDVLASFITANIPSTTQDLGNYDNRFILVTKDEYSRPINNSWSVSKSTESPGVFYITSTGAAEHGWTYMIVFENENIQATDIPYVFFDQNTYNNGYYTSTCISERALGASKGKIKWGSTSATIPDNFVANIVTVRSSGSITG